MSEQWPALPVADWKDTRDTLHIYTQVVGKVRMTNEPLSNHWWNVPLYITARGLTTSLMPHPTGRSFQIDFDFCDHRLYITTVDGTERSMTLTPPNRWPISTTRSWRCSRLWMWPPRSGPCRWR